MPNNLSPAQLKAELDKLHRRLISAIDTMSSQSEVLSYMSGDKSDIDINNQAEIVLVTILNHIDVSALVKTTAEAYYEAWTTVCKVATEAEALLKAADQIAAIREAQIDAVTK